jgi:hypothetical protein
VALTERLQAAGISAVLDDTTGFVESQFTHNELLHEFRVRLRKEDFARADVLLMEEADKELAEVADDHYLFSFSDRELQELLAKPDEWSAMDRLLARRLLKERGSDIGDAELEMMQEDRLAELAEPGNIHWYWIALGYALAGIGGIMGMVIGVSLATSKKTLPNGEQVPAWSQSDRQHGWTITVLGLIVFALVLVRLIL